MTFNFMNSRKYLLAVTVLIGSLSGCQYDLEEEGSNNNSEETHSHVVISTGTSFGFCVGYCQVAVSIDDGHISLVAKSSNEGDPDLTYEDEISHDNAAKILNEIEALDTLADVIGCPDCGDGGAEWVEKSVIGITKRVTIECGAQIEELAELLEVLRPLRSQFYENTGLNDSCYSQ